jgi:low temperature requirement protein LtrA
MHGPTTPDTHPALRRRDGSEAKVTYEELFFDLVYVFAVTQLSHYLLAHLTPLGALETLLLWFAVWLGWQYTCWVTNWFDPRTSRVRLLLFGVMLAGLVMSASIPGAFAERGVTFAAAFVTIQVGRSIVVYLMLRERHVLAANFRRILGWNCIAAVFWIAGAMAAGPARIGWWAVAVACEYVSPMFGFRLPGLGRSRTSDWTIEGGHLAERCQLFVIIALGESILITGDTFAKTHALGTLSTAAFVCAFVGSLAMWWLYFDTSSSDGSHAIEHADDPGRVGAHFHYVHVLLVGGIIVTAVGNELVIAHPHGHLGLAETIVMVGAPVAYLLGNGLYKRIVYGRYPLSHGAGLLASLALVALAPWADLLTMNVLTSVVIIGVAAWDTCRTRPGRKPTHRTSPT